MINIPPLRTRRLNVRMHELTIGAAIRLAGIAPSQYERATTEFLQAVVPADAGDVRTWTVQERMLAVCHYLAATAPGGDADFAVGESGRLTDYMDTASDYVASVNVGKACGDEWICVPLTGMAAEAIEMGATAPDDRAHWLMSMMAAQLLRVNDQGEVLPEDTPPQDVAGYTAWLGQRRTVLAAYPQSDFGDLLQLFYTGEAGLRHFFAIEPAGDGVVALAKGGGALPPARFPVGECISPVAQRLAQRLQDAGP